MANDSITDLSYIENISMGDDTLVMEMIELFLENTPESLEKLNKLYEQEDWQKLAAEAHKLKPNLSYMGLEEAKELIVELEGQVKNRENLETLPDKLERIGAICDQAYGELRSRLDNMKS